MNRLWKFGLVLVIVMCTFVPSAHSVARSDPHTLVRRCFEREAQLKSGHIEFQMHLLDASAPSQNQSGAYYFEWDTNGRFRLGIREDQDAFIAIGDGTSCYTEDGFIWGMAEFTNIYGQQHYYAIPMGENARLARSIYGIVRFRLLRPLHNTAWINATDFFRRSDPNPVLVEPGSINASWIGEEYLAAVRLRTMAIVGIGPQTYALDIAHAMPVRRYSRTDIVARDEPDDFWRAPFEIAPGVWLSQSLSGGSWAASRPPEFSLELFPESSRLGDIPSDRFVIPHYPAAQILVWNEPGPYDDSDTPPSYRFAPAHPDETLAESSDIGRLRNAIRTHVGALVLLGFIATTLCGIVVITYIVRLRRLNPYDPTKIRSS